MMIIVVAVSAAAIYFNQVGYGPNLAVKIQDFFQGNAYQPSAEMARIRNDLQLTDKGKFIFNSAQPKLSESDEFNKYCRSDSPEAAILGCYTMNNIYVYNITDAELDGIRELTTAHELLHAVWARMSDEEKTALVEPLTRTFEANQDFMAEEINNYDISQKQEELYVRAGTEVANLPADLERHYAEIFKNQDAVVAFYDKYIGVFRTLTAELDSLKAELDQINTVVTAKTAEYEQRSSQLNAEVTSFNSCARTTGCFKTEEEFEAKKSVLMGEQAALEALYEEINSLIASYNSKVEIYNTDVLRSENLNNMINSNSKPKDIE